MEGLHILQLQKIWSTVWSAIWSAIWLGHSIRHLVGAQGRPVEFSRTLDRPFGQAFGRHLVIELSRRVQPPGESANAQNTIQLAAGPPTIFSLDGSHCSARSQLSLRSAPASVSLHFYSCPRVLAFSLEALVCTYKEPK